MMRTALLLTLLSVTAIAQSGGPATATFEGSPAVVLANNRSSLTLLVKGGTMASIVLADDPEKLNPPSNPVRMKREQGRAATPSSSAGHFVCVAGSMVYMFSPTCAALVDRLTHHAEIIRSEGESYRHREAELTQKKRRTSP
jgi:hypothetical protein